MKIVNTIAWWLGIPLRFVFSVVFFVIVFLLKPKDYEQIKDAIKEVWEKP